MKKILILYTSHTQGHKVIAENMAFHLDKAGFQTRLEDILAVQSGWLVSLTRAFHHFVNQYARFVWRWLYLSPTFTKFSLPYRLKVASKNYHRTLSLVKEYNPDVIITTQTTASAVVAYLKQQNLFTGKFGAGFSDLHLHHYWLYDQVDFYLANIPEQKEEMVRLGVPANKIFVCGVMLKDQVVYDTEGTKKKFNIKPEDKVILVASGSFGYGLNADLILELSQKPNCKVIVATGKNPKEQKRLTEKFAGTNITVFGYYSPWEELCAIADIFVTKPGGITVTQALRYKLPMMVLYTLPGQEELNYSYLRTKGLIMPVPKDPVAEILEELNTQKFKRALENNSNLLDVLPKPEVLNQAVNSVL